MTIQEKAIQGQLDAYNNSDVKEFLKWYYDDVIGTDIDKNTVLFSGKNQMREVYTKMFNSEKRYCELMNRMVLGSMVIDYEHITKNECETFDAIAIYEVNSDGLIMSVKFTLGKKYS